MKAYKGVELQLHYSSPLHQIVISQLHVPVALTMDMADFTYLTEGWVGFRVRMGFLEKDILPLSGFEPPPKVSRYVE
jgi:hypothetical protein